MDKRQIRISYPIEEGFGLIGVSRTRGYQLIAAGDLQTYKDGKRRYVTRKALEACVATMQRNSEGRAVA